MSPTSQAELAFEPGVPLYVDLDGTLLKSDMLFESIFLLLKTSPSAALRLPFWFLKGRAPLKRLIAQNVQIDPQHLPYRAEVLELLREQHTKGRDIILATATDEILAQRIAQHLGLFSRVLGSDGSVNLKGENKARLIAAQQKGEAFAYLGDSRADIAIWNQANERLFVEASNKSLGRELRSKFANLKIVPAAPSRKTALIRALRVYQWVKNFLIFLPLILAHRLLGVTTAGHSQTLDALLAFFAFGCCSSVVYVLNDLLDLESDRQHPRKRHRPLASGELPISSGILCIPVLLVVAILLCSFLPRAFAAELLLYLSLTSLYSFYVKQLVLLDILLLAFLYTLRIIAGGAAVSVPVSQWMLAFSMFFFFSLACVKRYSELFMLRRLNQRATKGRGYIASDLEQIAQFGSSSGYISVLVLALYINSHDVVALYGQPQTLWLICPLLLYWISRVWLLAQRGNLHEDPVVFALTDTASYIVGSIAALLIYLAI